MRPATATPTVTLALALAALASRAAEPAPAPHEPARVGADRVMLRADAYSKSGRIDLLVASSATWSLPSSDARMWLPAFAVGTRLADKTKLPRPLATRTGDDFEAFLTAYDPTLLKTEMSFREPPAVGKNKLGACRRVGLIAPELVTNGTISDSLVVVRGGVRAAKGVGWSVVLANGNVSGGEDNLNKTVIVADGDIEVSRLAKESVLIARGNIKVVAAFESTLIAGGTIKGTEEKYALQDPKFRNVVKEGETNPLGIITFFELSQIGLTATEKDKAVRVAKLTEASPLRKAGVAVNDAVSKVNGSFVTTNEELRRALRDAIATKGEATLTVIRDGKTADIRVQFPE